ncbi:ABC transporter substrate-binding protein [Paenibacillus mesophilus]|uniref:ABC transporter substrate-binding protein n=1 Tax=Paenibacillus mesophilus TaxID=2582849 RepID=UPI00130514A4|nr:extracellular solute-binding protein [Paenibacillus mesophilus]
MKWCGWNKAIVFVMLSVMLAACSSGPGSSPSSSGDAQGDSSATSKGRDSQPVTLTIFATLDPAFMNQMGLEEAIRKKYPHLSIKLVSINSKDITFQSALASGQSPDLVCCSIASIGELKELQLISDLTPLMNAVKFDVNRLQPGMADVVRSYSEKGEFILMPFYTSSAVLYYNKGIFDKFAVPYPKDGMTWDELYEVAKRVTRLDNGIQYFGFTFNEQNITYKNQLGLAFIDPKTKKAAVNNDGWKHWMETMSMFARIPGNVLPPGASESRVFLNDQRTAMRTGQTLLPMLPEAEKNGLNWDLAALPEFTGMKGAGTQMNAPFFAIPPASKHKHEAFQFIEVMLSEEVQSNLSALGYVPVIRSEMAKQAFGSKYPELKGKNLQAFFLDAIAKPAPYSDYNSHAANIMFKKLVEVGGGKDANTALREADEAINKQLAELMR